MRNIGQQLRSDLLLNENQLKTCEHQTNILHLVIASYVETTVQTRHWTIFLWWYTWLDVSCLLGLCCFMVLLLVRLVERF